MKCICKWPIPFGLLTKFKMVNNLEDQKMKKTLIILFLCLLTLSASAKIINVNPDKNGEPWIVGGLSELTANDWQVINSIPKLNLSNRTKSLPSSVDNSLQPAFRPIFSQQGGSCGQASGIGYTFTYEMNTVRGTAANTTTNQYPTHFTWNYINGGVGNGSWYYQGWDIIKDAGCPNVADYGGSLWEGGDKRWMSGYTQHFNGLHNRVTNRFDIQVGTPAGLTTFKQWVYDHGNGSAKGGIGCFAAGATDYTMTTLPAGTPNAGKKVMKKWGTQVNHAMTFVGYDDNVKYDYNGDGLYTNNKDTNGDGAIDMRDWEVGAVIMVNSWGTGWGDNGHCYVPYRLLAETPANGGIWNKSIMVVEVASQTNPLLVLKVKVKNTARSKINLTASMNTNTSASSGVNAKTFELSKNRGGDLFMQGGTTEDQKTIEYALDISSFRNYISNNQPVKLFFTVNRNDPSNIATGSIVSMSVVDYTSGQNNPAETVCSQSNVTLNQGATTVSLIKNTWGNTTYALIVSNGSGSGNYATGSTKTITANSAPNGKVFDTWVKSSGNPTIANANSASTTLTMPASAVTVTATYKNIVGPTGYNWCAGESGTYTLSGTCDVAYGANGQFYYKYNQTGTITFNPATFGGDPVPNVLKSGFYKPSASLRPADNPANTVNGLDYKYYQGDWNALPNFATLTPASSSTMANFSISGAPQTDYFGYSFTGYVNVPTDGVYTFYTSSDDGSKLYIGSTLVVSNDALQPATERSGQIGLKAGKHAIKVEYFEKTGGQVLDVLYAGPGITKQLIPNNKLYRVQAASEPAGYTWCADENQSYALSGTCDVAYGANGKFNYKYGVTGTINFNNTTFGDPIPGVAKSGFYKKITITSNLVLGYYSRQPIQNNWQTGVIEMSGNTMQWRNNAGVTWPLIPDLANGKLLTTSACPYYNSTNGNAFILKIRSSNGTTIVEGFWFLNDFYSFSTNIALNRGTAQSSTAFDIGVSGKAVDGNTNGVWNSNNNSVTHTNYQAGAWWYVDLGALCDVNSVILWNRAECSERLSNFHVDFIAADGATIVVKKDYPRTAGNKTIIDASATGVRFVRVQLYGTNYLSLAEVQVMGVANSVKLASRTDILEEEIPHVVELSQNYPNPFNPTTTINFTLPENGSVKLAVMNAKGETVKVLASGNYQAGNHSFDFDGSKLNSGVYFYRLVTPEKTITKKMILIK